MYIHFIGTQTKEQAPKLGLCCLTYPYDCHALAAPGIQASPETAKAVFDK